MIEITVKSRKDFFCKSFFVVLICVMMFNAFYMGKNTTIHWDTEKYMTESNKVWQMKWQGEVDKKAEEVLDFESWGIDLNNKESIPKVYSSTKELQRSYNYFHLLMHIGALYGNNILFKVAEGCNMGDGKFILYQIELMILFSLGITFTIYSLVRTRIDQEIKEQGFYSIKLLSILIILGIITSPMFISTSKQGISELYSIFFIGACLYAGEKFNRKDTKKVQSAFYGFLTGISMFCIMLNRIELIIIPPMLIAYFGIKGFVNKENRHLNIFGWISFIVTFWMVFIIYGVQTDYFFWPTKFYRIAVYPASLFWSAPNIRGGIHALIVGAIPFISIIFFLNKKIVKKMFELKNIILLVGLVGTIYALVTIGYVGNSDMRAKTGAFYMLFCLTIILLSRSNISKNMGKSARVVAVILILLNIYSALIAQRLYIETPTGVEKWIKGGSIKNIILEKKSIDRKYTRKSLLIATIEEGLNSYIIREDKMRFFDAFDILDRVRADDNKEVIVITNVKKRHVYNIERIGKYYSDKNIVFTNDIISELDKAMKTEKSVYLAIENIGNIKEVSEDYIFDSIYTESSYDLIHIDKKLEGNGGLKTFLEISQNEYNNGELVIRGWVLVHQDISEIVVEVNGENVGNALYPMKRPDIEKAFPEYKNSLQSGYSFRGKIDIVKDSKMTCNVIVYSNDKEIKRKQFILK